MATSKIQATCGYGDCDNTGESYNDGQNFERVHMGHHGPQTLCLNCRRTF